MKTINKRAAVMVFSGLMFGAFANDTPTSPFSCQAQSGQIQKIMMYSNSLPETVTCGNGLLSKIQLSSNGNVVECTGSSSSSTKAPNSACEVNPQYWVETAPVRHTCDPHATPDECAVEVY